MRFRERLDARLVSQSGEQRLSRALSNVLSRTTLIPSEPLSSWPESTVRWAGGRYVLEAGNRAIAVDGVKLPPAPWPLVDGARFTAGKTEVTCRLRLERWPVDLERERALRADDAAWGVFADQLLSTGDPLGSALQNDASFDVAYALEVAPAVAQRLVTLRPDSRGLWRELTFHFEVTRNALTEGVLASVLLHPRASFVESVVLRVTQRGRRPQEWQPELWRPLVELIGRLAGPHLARVAVPAAPMPLPERPEVVVMVSAA